MQIHSVQLQRRAVNHDLELQHAQRRLSEDDSRGVERHLLSDHYDEKVEVKRALTLAATVDRIHLVELGLRLRVSPCVSVCRGKATTSARPRGAGERPFRVFARAALGTHDAAAIVVVAVTIAVALSAALELLQLSRLGALPPRLQNLALVARIPRVKQHREHGRLAVVVHHEVHYLELIRRRRSEKGARPSVEHAALDAKQAQRDEFAPHWTLCDERDGEHGCRDFEDVVVGLTQQSLALLHLELLLCQSVLARHVKHLARAQRGHANDELFSGKTEVRQVERRRLAHSEHVNHLDDGVAAQACAHRGDDHAAG